MHLSLEILPLAHKTQFEYRSLFQGKKMCLNGPGNTVNPLPEHALFHCVCNSNAQRFVCGFAILV